MFDPLNFCGKVILQDGFYELFNKLKNSEIKLPEDPEIIGEFRFEPLDDIDGTTLSYVDEDFEEKYSLDPYNGEKVYKESSTLISAYDESIAKYAALECKMLYVSHSLITLYKDNYYPVNLLAPMIVTASEKIFKELSEKNEHQVFLNTEKKWSVDQKANVEVAKQKREFLEKHIHEKTILLIDGPFIAGDGYATFKAIKKTLIDKNIFPVFIVKNSESDLITRSIREYRGQYNSDLHLVNEILKTGERTRLYNYTDSHKEDNTKVFCYIKFSDRSSPIRIEIPTEIYEMNKFSVRKILDLVYYLILVQGDYRNPQARPIAVAEKYARETLRLIDFKKMVRASNFTPTINEERGMEHG